MTYKELNGLSINELRSLNKKIIETIKLKTKQLSLEVKDTLSVGDQVNVNHPKLEGKVMVIEKINITKAVIKPIHGGAGYRVPLSLLTLA